jgi:phosphonatase-like hydrolase
MTGRAIDLVVLDLAGTTVEDGGQVPDAFAAALASYGVHVTTDEITRVRGASKRQAIRELLQRRGVPLHLCDEVYTTFCDNLEKRYARTARPLPGAEQTIVALRGSGLRVALNTGFERATTNTLLEAIGWASGVADAVVCGDEVKEGRPAADMIRRCMDLTGITEPARVANVGDTVLDLRAGHRAGVRLNIGVLSGAHGRAALAAEPHTHIVESVANVPELL